MPRGIWLLLFFCVVLVIAAVVTVVLLANRPNLLQDLPPESTLNPVLNDAADPSDFSDEDVARLQGQLEDSDRIVRLAAIGQLRDLASADSGRFAPLLIKELTNSNDTVRYIAAKGLGDMRYIPAAKHLADLLNDPTKDVRIQAGEALIALGDDGLAAIMTALAEDRIRSIDTVLNVVTSITEVSFGKGKQGRDAALRYWTEQNRQTP